MQENHQHMLNYVRKFIAESDEAEAKGQLLDYLDALSICKNMLCNKFARNTPIIDPQVLN